MRGVGGVWVWGRVVAVVVCGGVLAGCASSLLSSLPVSLSPSPSVSVSSGAGVSVSPGEVYVSFYPVELSPPRDAGEVIAYAVRVTEGYYQARSVFRADPSRKEDALLVYAKGPQAQADIKASEQAQQMGVTRAGQYRFEPEAAAATTSELRERVNGVDTPVAHGLVQLPGCEDVTDLSAVGPQGQAYVVQGLHRYRVVITVMYSPSESKWLVYDLNLEAGEEQTPC